MTDRYRATIVVEFDGKDTRTAAKKASEAARKAKKELPSDYETENRSNSSVQSVEKVTKSREVVKRTVEIEEEHQDNDD